MKMEEECEKMNIKECLLSNDENNPIKSATTVKYQMVRSPTNFVKLQCNTNLNIPPKNWLNSSMNSYGLQPALSQSTGFSSFRMAHLFSDCLGEVDVITNAENIKRLLELPYASNCTISMMVHRVGNTLLIDDFDIHRFLLQQEDCNWLWLKSFICDHILSRLNDQERNFSNRQPASQNEAIQQKSLLSKFLYHSLLTNTTSEKRDSRNLDFFQSNSHLQHVPLLPDPNIEENVPDPNHTNHNFNRNVVWTFEDIRMLVGTDMAIFGNLNHPCICLRLRDMHEPINVLTGIDYWLDNLMCNVPEVVMCYHLDGLVQKYEIIKTEDLPNLTNSQFSPNTIRNVAQNILSFLKQNATKSGHTYWLFKGPKDDVVKLYDLTSLGTTGEFNDKTQSPNDEKPNKSTENTDKNPFTVPVAMLLYKVAKNIKNSSEKIQPKQAGSIKALLENCVKLLPKEQYPQIVTSSFYLLCDLHVPTILDPTSSIFENEINDPENITDGENHNSDDSDEQSVSGTNTPVGSKEYDSDIDLEKRCSSPPPLVKCFDSALEYVVSGLNCLKYIPAKLNEAAKKDEKNVEKLLKKTNLEEKSTQSNPFCSRKSRRKKSSKWNKSVHTQPPQNIDGENPSQGTEWNAHLKLLLLEKSCLIYATLGEQAFQQEEFGRTLNFISFAKKCYQVVKKFPSTSIIGKNYYTNILARAGDCYFKCAQNVNYISVFIEQYNKPRDIDLLFEKELQEEFADEIVELEYPIDNLEQLMLKSISSYESALKFTEEDSSRCDLYGRIGNVLNELGVRYMNWADPKNASSKADIDKLTLAKKSFDCLNRGIAAFEKINDDANLAILLCNMGRFMRFRAHLEEDGFSFKKKCYDAAFKSYHRALTILEENSQFWDIVTWELSSGKFTFGKLLLEHFRNDMNIEIQQEIIELLFSSLKLCDSLISSPHKLTRSGLINQCVGNVYVQSYKNECRNDARKKNLLSLSLLYYKKSAILLKEADALAELFALQIDRLDFQDMLFKGAQTPFQKIKSLQSSLRLACELTGYFKIENSEHLELEQLRHFESKLQTILKHSIQMLNKNESECSAKYKKIYLLTLQSTVDKSDAMHYIEYLREILETIQRDIIEDIFDCKKQ